MISSAQISNSSLLVSLAVIGQGLAQTQDPDQSALESYMHSSDPYLHEHPYIPLVSKDEAASIRLAGKPFSPVPARYVSGERRSSNNPGLQFTAHIYRVREMPSP